MFNKTGGIYLVSISNRYTNRNNRKERSYKQTYLFEDINGQSNEERSVGVMSGAPLLEVLSEKTNLENRTQSCYRKNWRCRRASPQKKGKYFVCRDKRVNRFPRTGVFLRVLRRAALTFTTSLVIPFHQPLINCSWWRVFLGGGSGGSCNSWLWLTPPPPLLTLRLQIFHIHPEETRRDVTKAVFTY